MRTWLLLTHKIPREPSARRVFVWRKLKRLGALPLQDAVWVLPATPANREHLQWLSAEIVEADGQATLWEAHLTLDGQEENLIRQFEEQSEAAYREILDALRSPQPDLSALSRQYQQAAAQDFFRCRLGSEVRSALVAASGQAGRERKRR